MDYSTLKRNDLIKAACERFGPPANGQPLRFKNDALRAGLEAGTPPAGWADASNGAKGNGNGASTDEVAAAISAALRSVKGGVDTAEVEAIVERKVAELGQPRRLVVERPEREPVDVGLAHRQLPQLLQAIEAGLNVLLVGPAASGKTYACEQAAQALERGFVAQSFCAQTTKSDLFGFIDASGTYQESLFFDAYTRGKVYLGDEFDSGNANVATLFNAATSNHQAGFPSGMAPKHDDFVFVGAMNTIGLGSDAVYVGRNQLDGATRDRFVFLPWGYDDELERALNPEHPSWVERCQKLRKAVDSIPAATRPRVLITPRATQQGSALLSAGWERDEVEQACVWNKCSDDDRRQIEAAVA